MVETTNYNRSWQKRNNIDLKKRGAGGKGRWTVEVLWRKFKAGALF